MHIFGGLLIIFCLLPQISWAGATLSLDTSYLYSTLNDQGAFSMVGNNGFSGRGEFSLGGPRFDVLITGEMRNAKFMAPASRTVEGASIQSSAYSGGLRWKTSFAWLGLSYNSRDSLFLETVSTNVYNLRKAAVPFASMLVHFFGMGRGYQLGVDVEGFFPVGSVSTVAGDMKYQYAGRGSVELAFGNKFKWGIRSGIETHQYSVASDKYFRTEFFAGLTFGYVFSSGNSGGGPDNAFIPGWPIR